MTNIKIGLISGLLFLTITAFSQFSVNTELKYLQIVNNQENKDLIADNLPNAEFLADSLILLKDNSFLKSQFFIELSKSYYLLKKYDLSLFSLLRQRCLFPNKIIQKQSENLFTEAIYSNNLSDSLTKIILTRTSFQNIPQDFKQQFNLLLEISTIINTKEISYPIYKIGLVYRGFESNIPLWYQHWEYLTIIKLKPKNIKQVMLYAKTKEPIYKQTQNKKLKYKIYRKSIKHYRKHDSYKTAYDLLTEYKTYNLNSFLKIDAIYKSIHLKVNKLL